MFIRFSTVLLALLLTFSALANENFDNGLKAYDAKDYLNAFTLFTKAANQGDADAQVNLGTMYDSGRGVKQDAAQAFAWYQKAANQGHAAAQSNLAAMYDLGRGVKKDLNKALAWYQKSANQGRAFAQYILGDRYENGRDGVKQDYAQAFAWYQKAANQDHANAQYRLAIMYENGRGVKKDLNKALALYKKSNTQLSKEKYVALDKIINCDKKSKTQLFNVNLKCANRNTLMAAAKQAGATVKREDKGKWGDEYFTSKILKGSSELSIDYTVDDFFAQAKYTFPSHMDAAQVSKVKSFVANKYGKPDTTMGNTSVGEVKYQWKLEDGIELNVSRGWPDTTTYLTYVYPENFQAMKTEQEKQRKAREAKQYESQGNAF